MTSSRALTLTTTLLLASLTAAETKTVASFDGDDSLRWMTVNDGVMGGLSQGDWQLTDRGTLLFSGSTSLRNNGGFSSIRTQPAALQVDGFDGIWIRVRGDGRSYKLSLRTDAASRWIAYWAPFETVAGEWQDIRIPFSDWVPTVMGQKQRGPSLDVASINSVGFMLYDKQAGPFSLEVDAIVAYRGEVAPSTAEATSDKASDTPNLVELATEAGRFDTLLTAASAAGLAEALATGGPFTLFAPRDVSFAALPGDTLERLLAPESRIELIRLLQHHIVPGNRDAAWLLEQGTVETLAGTKLTFTRDGNRVLVNGVEVIVAGADAANGLIHVVEDVLVPSLPSTSAQN